MDDKTKDGYVVAGSFVAVGLLLMYVDWGNFDLTFFMSVGLIGLGAAGFKWPGVAEVLVHWAKNQDKSNNSNSIQTQKNTKNSNQVITNSGDVHIHQYADSKPTKKRKGN